MYFQFIDLQINYFFHGIQLEFKELSFSLGFPVGAQKPPWLQERQREYIFFLQKTGFLRIADQQLEEK